MIPEFDCFNLLDSHTVLGRDGYVGAYDAAAGTPWTTFNYLNDVYATLPGRTFRGGVRIAF